MIDIPYREKIKLKNKAILVVLSLSIVGIITGLIISNLSYNIASDIIKKDFPDYQIDVYPYPVSMVITCVIFFFLVALIFIYIKIVRETKSKFVFVLLLFLIPLALHSFFNIFYLHLLTIYSGVKQYHELIGVAFSSSAMLGTAVFVVSIFELIAMGSLLYISMK